VKAARGAFAGLLALVAQLACAAPVAIVWAPAESGALKSAHGAVLLPVRLGPLQCLMQLDTAALDTTFYRGTLPPAWIDKAESTATLPGLSIGDVAVDGHEFPVFPGAMTDPKAAPCGPGHADVLVGTLGLDVLKGGSIVIDMRAGRFEFIDRGVLPGGAVASRSFAFAAAPGVDPALPVVNVAGRNGRHYRLLLDTGSAPVGALFYREREWLDETPFASRTAPFPIVRWGRPASCRLGEGTLHITAEPSALDMTDKVSYCALGGEQAAAGNPLNGLLGLLPFENQRLTIDFVHRLASVEPSLSPTP
jgi:hypothetical protein